MLRQERDAAPGAMPGTAGASAATDPSLLIQALAAHAGQAGFDSGFANPAPQPMENTLAPAWH